MRIRNFAVLALLLPALVHGADQQAQPLNDTFEALLKKQAQLQESEIDLKLQLNRNQAAVNAPGSNPLPGVRQEVNEKEPVVEAIWGLAGKEVAEINYKGRRLPVSMQEPFISKIDGWKLESIQQYQVQLVRTSGGRVLQRKTIMFDWLGGGGVQSADESRPNTPPMLQGPITPSLTPQAIR